MERRLYGHLLTQESPDHQKLKKAQNSAMKDFYLGPSSLVLPTNAAAAFLNTQNKLNRKCHYVLRVGRRPRYASAKDQLGHQSGQSDGVRCLANNGADLRLLCAHVGA